ncbi:MAG: DUF4440 domain-containing protein [Flavobacteriaceae bacterium]|nr:DUF4440 domain-containing protein [Flavobacteriaceae bacterium]|tara:strand:- start:111242 stop:111712 length:471 start_codon:yes stop_codon:yes gene_type:complete
MTKKINTLVALFLLAFSSMGFAQNFSGDAKDIEQILGNIKSFSAHVMASNYQEIGNAYTEDAKIFPSNKDIIAGKQNIIKYWILPKGFRTKYHKITPQEIKVIGDEAYDYGYYEGTTARPNGSESNWKGKYVIIWKKVADDWKIYLDIWNPIASSK